MVKDNNERKVCPACKSGEIYVLVDGTIVCRKCGARSKP